MGRPFKPRTPQGLDKAEHHPLFSTLLTVASILTAGSVLFTWVIFISEPYAPVRDGLSLAEGLSLWATTVGPYFIIANIVLLVALNLDSRVHLGSLIEPLVPEEVDATPVPQPLPRRQRKFNSSAKQSMWLGLFALFCFPLAGFFAIRRGWDALGVISVTEKTQRGRAMAWVGLVSGALAILPSVLGALYIMGIFFFG